MSSSDLHIIQSETASNFAITKKITYKYMQERKNKPKIDLETRKVMSSTSHDHASMSHIDHRFRLKVHQRQIKENILLSKISTKAFQ